MELPENFQLELLVNPEQIANRKASPLEVTGYPIHININMKSGPAEIAGYYVHLLQREENFGREYYYQGSIPLSMKGQEPLPVWLGREGEIDLDKTFIIHAVVNRNPAYSKDADGIRTFPALPGPSRGKLTVKRVR